MGTLAREYTRQRTEAHVRHLRRVPRLWEAVRRQIRAVSRGIDCNAVLHLVLVGGALNPGRNAEAAQMGVSNKNRRLYVTMQYISAHAFRARGGYRLFEVERRSGSDGSL